MWSPIRCDGGSAVYCLNFISRIVQREHTCACTRCCCAAAHVLRTKYVYQTTRGTRGWNHGIHAGRRRGWESRRESPGEILEAARKPSRRPRSFFPFMRFIRSCHFVCPHPRAVPRRCVCACVRAGPCIVVEGRRNGTLRYGTGRAVSLEYLGGGGHILFRRAR